MQIARRCVINQGLVTIATGWSLCLTPTIALKAPVTTTALVALGPIAATVTCLVVAIAQALAATSLALGIPCLPPERRKSRKLVGREMQMNSLRNSVLKAHHNVLISAGFGEGKSELVHHFFDESALNFRGGRFWLECGERRGDQILWELLRALGVRPDPDWDLNLLSARAHTCLGTRNCLVILDDIRSHHLRILDLLLPPEHSVCVVTTRIQDTPIPNFEQIKWRQLQEQDALEILRLEWSGKSIAQEEETARMLAREVGFNPLSVCLSGARCRKAQEDGQEYPARAVLNRFRETRFHRSLQPGAIPETSSKVWRSVLASVEELPARDRTWFQFLGALALPVFSSATAANLFVSNVEQAEKALKSMEALNLVQHGPWRMHDLVHLAARLHLTKNSNLETIARARHAVRFLPVDNKASYYRYQDVWHELPEIDAAADWLLARQSTLSEGLTSHLGPITMDKAARIYLTLADHAGSCGEWNIAQTCAERALALYRVLGDQLGEANSLQAIGNIRMFQGRSGAALWTWLQTMDLSQTKGGHLPRAVTPQAKGEIHELGAEMDAVLSIHQEALRLFKRAGSRWGQADSLFAIGIILQYRAALPAALDSYREALEHFKAVRSRVGEAGVVKAIGDLQRSSDEPDLALKTYNVALKLYRAEIDRQGEARTLLAIGMVMRFRKDYQAAYETLQQALKLFRGIRSGLGEAGTLKAIRDTQELQGKDDVAPPV